MKCILKVNSNKSTHKGKTPWSMNEFRLVFANQQTQFLAPFLCSNIQHPTSETSIFHIFHRNNVNHKSHVSYSFSVHFSSLLFYILLQNNNFDGTYFNSHSSVKNVFVLFSFLSLKFLDPIYKLFYSKTHLHINANVKIY